MESETLRDSFRKVLEKECPLSSAHRNIESGRPFTERLWNTVASLGWLGLNLPAEYGGSELGLDALVLLYEESGRALAPIPLLPTLLAGEIILQAGTPAQHDFWLPKISSGAVKAAVSSPHPLQSSTVSARETLGGLVLSGTATAMLHAGEADLLLILATLPEGQQIRVAIDPRTDQVQVDHQPVWDQTRSLGNVNLNGVEVSADRVFPVTPTSENELLIHTALAMAADAIGGSDAILLVTLDYLKVRLQFGHPIGSFQALKHRVSNHQTGLIGDRALLGSAAHNATTKHRNTSVDALAVNLQACRNYSELARDALQLHGGIGFTAEHVCHLFLKRARLNESLFGLSGSAYTAILDHLLAEAAQ